MRVRVIAIGKADVKFLSEAIHLYLGRIKHYIPFEYKIIPEAKNTGNLTPNQIAEMESVELIKHIKKNEALILLDQRGRHFNSVSFADYIESYMNNKSKDILFAIGGSYGFTPIANKHATDSIALSKLTLPHQLVRLIFLEQFYRAMTIIRKEPYHH